MNVQTHIRRPMALVLLAAASLGIGVMPASAAPPGPTMAEVPDAVGDAVSRFGTGSVPDADIVKARVDHGVSSITLTAWFAGGVDPRTNPAFVPNNSRVQWLLDVNDDWKEDLVVDVDVTNGELVGWVYDGGGKFLCHASAATYDQATFRYRATVPRSCLGNPASLRFYAYVDYVAKVGPETTEYWSDTAPALGAFSAPAHRARIATSLSSSVSTSSLVYGQGVTVSGTLTRTSNGKAVAGQKVTLQRKYPGGSYTNIGTATTSSTGKVAFPLKPSKNATYRLRHAYAGRSGPGFDTIASSGRSVTVKPKVTLTPSATTVASGTTVRLTTKVSPKHAGMEVKLQKRRSDGTWATVQTGKLNSESTRTFRITASRSTVGTYRVVAPKHHDHATGTSPTRTIKLG